MRRFLYLALFQAVLGQRSILLERACRRNPRLSFCKELMVPAQTFDIPPPLPPTAHGDMAASRHSDRFEAMELVIPPPVPEHLTTQIILKPKTTTAKPMPASTEAEVVEEEMMTVNETTTLSSKSTTTTEFTTDQPVTESVDARFGLVPLPKPHMSTTKHSNEAGSTSHKTLESDTHVLVFVSEYCVNNRERFVRKCHGKVLHGELEFCKAYPTACSGTSSVIPVLNYCGRYYMEYPRLCRRTPIHQLSQQFCYAFERFCMPELAARKLKKPDSSPRSNLQKCSDVLPQARKVCNPFPKPTDPFNVVRCSEFLKSCKSYVDWHLL